MRADSSTSFPLRPVSVAPSVMRMATPEFRNQEPGSSRAGVRTLHHLLRDGYTPIIEKVGESALQTDLVNPSGLSGKLPVTSALPAHISRQRMLPLLDLEAHPG